MKLSKGITGKIAIKDDRAYKELYAFYRNIVSHFCYNSSEREDLVQETMLSVAKSNIQYDPNRATQENYFTTIMKRKAIDIFRKKKIRIKPSYLECDPEDKKQEINRAEREEDLAEVMLNIPPLSKETFRLFYGSNLTIDQIEKATRTPSGTSKTHLKRGRAKVLELISS